MLLCTWSTITSHVASHFQTHHSAWHPSHKALVKPPLALCPLVDYMSKVLKNYTERACDGEFLSVRCPPRTTITVQSAFYGRRGSSDPQRCPQSYQALLSPYRDWEDDRHCSVSTALQVSCGPPSEFSSALTSCVPDSDLFFVLLYKSSPVVLFTGQLYFGELLIM